MKTITKIGVAIALCTTAVCAGTSIFNGKLSTGFNMGVDTDKKERKWMKVSQNQIAMSYPVNQEWGTVFITVGNPSPMGSRRWKDFSNLDTLLVTARGKVGGEFVLIGMKDNSDPDDGTETKFPITLSKTDSTYKFAIKDFITLDKKMVYIPCEFVFESSGGSTRPVDVFVKEIMFK